MFKKFNGFIHEYVFIERVNTVTYEFVILKSSYEFFLYKRKAVNTQNPAE